MSSLATLRKLPLYTHLIWFGLSLLLWSIRFYEYGHQRGDWALVPFAKGVLLLVLAAGICVAACRRRPEFLYLGSFTLGWLGLSKFQWDLCVCPDDRYWFWLVLFLVGELLLFTVQDGQKLLVLVSSLWAALSFLFPFSLFQFFSFGWARDGYFLKKAVWVRYGVPLVGLVAFVVLNGATQFHFLWYDLYEVFFTHLYLSFFLLGLLGITAFSTRKRFWSAAFGPLLLLPLGFLFLSGTDMFSPLKQELLKWVLVFYAGFGWESFRRDLMDRSWHGHLVWFLLGLCFFGGVLY